MKPNPEYFKPFPAYEEVFYDDIENHKKYFLPICSFNLKCIDPSRDEWFHFISVKEIVEGYVGDNTHQFHTKYTKEGMYAFNIIDGKYKFEAPWDYFDINHQQPSDDEHVFTTFDKHRHSLKTQEDFEQWISKLNCSYSAIEDLQKLFKQHYNNSNLYKTSLAMYAKRHAYPNLYDIHSMYRLNTEIFELVKQYYNKHKKLAVLSSYESLDLDIIEKRIAKEKEEYPDIDFGYNAEFFGFIEDIKHTSKETKDHMVKENISLQEMNSLESFEYILHNIPVDHNNKIFEYIGYLSGDIFQQNGADGLYLFFNPEIKKAVFCTEFS